MERLTFYGGKTGQALGKIGNTVIPRSLILDEISFGPILDKLAAYEDTGLSPSEVQSILDRWLLYGGEQGIADMNERLHETRVALENQRRKSDELEATLYATRSKKEN